MVSNFDSPVNFKIGLLYWVFDSTSNNVRLYKNKGERDVYINDLVEIWQDVEVNIPFNDNVNLSLNFDIDSVDENDILKLLNYNYCVISNETNQQKYYYFINEIKQVTSTMLHLDLKIDALQTYIYELKFPLSIINKAHVNRFLPADKNGLYKFNNLPDSHLLNSDLSELPKFIESRQENIAFFDETENSELNDFLLKQNTNWMYVYLTRNADVFDNLQTFKTKNYIDNTSYVDLGFSIVVAPLTDTDNIKVTDNLSGIYSNWNAKSIFDLLRLEDANFSPYILSIKISPTPPFTMSKLIKDKNYKFINDGLTLILEVDKLEPFNVNLIRSSKDEPVANIKYVNIFKQPEKSFFDVEINKQFVFKKDEIINNKNNIITEPGLLSQNITALHISDFAGNNFDYDLQKLGNNKLRFYVTEQFTPDIAKTYIRFKGDNETVYNEISNYNLTGLITSNDLSIPFDTEQLKLFLAQNKNFFLQQQTNRVNSAINEAVGITAGATVAGSAILPGGGSLVGASVGAVTGSFYAINKFITSKFNQDLTIDNMRASPNKVSNAQGNYLFVSTINQNLKFYVDIYKPVEIDKLKAYWLIYMFGYALNIFDDIKNYMHTRKVFNFINATVLLLDGKISNNVKELIKSALSNGVFFWHQDKIDYTLANYEVYLDEIDKEV